MLKLELIVKGFFPPLIVLVWKRNFYPLSSLDGHLFQIQLGECWTGLKKVDPIHVL